MGGARMTSAVLAMLALAGCARGEPVEPVAPRPSGTTSAPSPAPSATTSNAPVDPSGSSTGRSPSATSTTPTIPDNLRIGISVTDPGIGLRTAEGYQGLDADLGRALAAELGASRVTFVEAVPDQRESLLGTNQVDLVLGSYSMSRKRAQQVTFAGPYLTTGQDLLVRKGSKITRPDQLRGAAVCSPSGSTSTDELVADHPGLRVVEQPTVAACVELLKSGEVRAVTSDAAVLAGHARTSRSPDKLVLARHPFTTERWGIAVRHGDLPMCRAVSTALRRMTRSGEWRKAVRDNLPTAAVIGKRTHTPPAIEPCRVVPAPTES